MGEEFSTNGKFTTAVINYLSENYAKEGKPLINGRYKKSYLYTFANKFFSELSYSNYRVVGLIEIFARCN